MLNLLPFLAAATGMEFIATLPESEQAFIVEQIESRRDPLSGPGIIVDFAKFPLGNGGPAGSLVLYMYESGENRDRSGATFLTLVRHNDEDISATPPLLIGFTGRRVIDDMEVSGTNIMLRGRYWSAGDAQCCPSAVAESLMIFDGDRLIEVSGNWKRQEIGQ